jgi:hypothetical protein
MWSCKQMDLKMETQVSFWLVSNEKDLMRATYV